MLDVDHIFVLTAPGAPEQATLAALGLAVGVARRHPGQGTQNVCFGFADAYLELLWTEAPATPRIPEAAVLRLEERGRWRDNGASPFGICVGPASPDSQLPFPDRPYRPGYLPPGVSIRLAEPADVREPLLFTISRRFAPFAVRHALSDRALARVVVTAPAIAAGSPLRTLRVPRLEIRQGDGHLLELELEGAAGKEADLRPALPVVLRC